MEQGLIVSEIMVRFGEGMGQEFCDAVKKELEFEYPRALIDVSELGRPREIPIITYHLEHCNEEDNPDVYEGPGFTADDELDPKIDSIIRGITNA